MNRVTARDSDGDLWERVSKTRARKVWDAGQEVCFICCNFYPFGSWGFGSVCRRSDAIDTTANTLDDKASDYEYYNCPDSETGRYCAFYVRVKEGKV